MDHRSERMKAFIVTHFYNCLEQEDFSKITIGHISEMAQINRSTFYRHFEDKYQLRDYVVDEIITYFVGWLEVDFLDLNIKQDQHYSTTLKKSLENIYARKRELEILWNQKLLGRNVFEEMIENGAKKIEDKILAHPTISDSKKQLSDWYARLLMNNMLVSIRWWFAHSDEITSNQLTNMMKQHMIAGTIPTLKSP